MFCHIIGQGYIHTPAFHLSPLDPSPSGAIACRGQGDSN